MFGFALFAACIPAHDDWLNDLSSTPPVSSTMHALSFLPEAVPVAAVELPDALAPLLAELLLAGLLPQPARAIAATAETAAIFITERTVSPFRGATCLASRDGSSRMRVPKAWTDPPKVCHPRWGKSAA